LVWSMELETKLVILHLHLMQISQMVGKIVCAGKKSFEISIKLFNLKTFNF
jgi:hypothetical protein